MIVCVRFVQKIAGFLLRTVRGGGNFRPLDDERGDCPKTESAPFFDEKTVCAGFSSVIYFYQYGAQRDIFKRKCPEARLSRSARTLVIL